MCNQNLIDALINFFILFFNVTLAIMNNFLYDFLFLFFVQMMLMEF